MIETTEVSGAKPEFQVSKGISGKTAEIIEILETLPIGQREYCQRAALHLASPGIALEEAARLISNLIHGKTR